MGLQIPNVHFSGCELGSSLVPSLVDVEDRCSLGVGMFSLAFLFLCNSFSCFSQDF